jgi:hypothetical protein
MPTSISTIAAPFARGEDDGIIKIYCYSLKKKVKELILKWLFRNAVNNRLSVTYMVCGKAG